MLDDDRDATKSMKRLPLDDVRVVECGDGVAAAFAAKLMALLGAEVIKVEPPRATGTACAAHSSTTISTPMRVVSSSTSMRIRAVSPSTSERHRIVRNSTSCSPLPTS